MEKVIIICGPTASSKSALAIECAKLLNTEIISADSMNVYRGLDIGSAKPTVQEMQGIKHHLIDVVDADQTFSVGDYRELAMPVIEDLHSKGKIPVICGGTGFYINSLIYDLSYGNSCANLEAREKYKNIAEQEGNQKVYDILMQVDPETAKKLHVNDVKRVIRALEIYESGYKKSEIKDNLTPRYDYKAYCVNYPTETLYERINKRVDIMFESGLISEVKSIYDTGIDENYQCMQGIGYKEVAEGLEKGSSIEEIKELIKKNTRNYAKRQITFFKRMQNHTYLTKQNATADEVIKLLTNEN